MTRWWRDWDKIVPVLFAQAEVTVTLSSVAIAILLLLSGKMGALQSLELVIYDYLIRWQGDRGFDDRVLVVGISEADINFIEKWPPSDRVIAQLLRELQRYDPAAIGLDFMRDIPYSPGHEELVAELAKPNVFGIRYVGNNPSESTSPPPSLPGDRVGFNDVVTDPDGVVRRTLMFTSNGQQNFLSLSLRLALFYLKNYNITPKLNEKKVYQLGHVPLEKLTQTWGGYQTIDPGGYQILLDYRDLDPVPVVSMQAVLEGAIEPSAIAGKIILIGPVAPSVKDVFLTPYSATVNGNRKMPGVLIHAQMVSQFLSAGLDDLAPVSSWPEPVEWVWILAACLLGGAIGLKVSNPWRLTASAIALGCVFFAFGLLCFLQRIWIPIATPIVGALSAGAIAVIYQLQQARKQQKMVMNLLGQQTSPEIASALWDRRDRLLKAGVLPGETVTVTVFFSDIKNFTTISEQLPSEKLMVWLNEYLDAMTDIVIDHQGIINKFIGDAIMAVFGVPIPRTTEAEISEDARRSVRCSLAMRERLQQLNSSWKERGFPIIQIRAGIFTGPVTVGSLGGKKRLEYGIIGDSVNIASRLESSFKDRQVDNCRILISGETYHRLKSEIEVESWGAMNLKGKEKEVEVYRVIGHKIERLSEEP
ncbi:CHASE2 domain-containing protein [Oxynema aestuarii]|uniref:Adenylate/guanylate cyclase domain-containing protein n=1 Tax=Oxynema aestuarii AP17 TaxID=2064643 RepID=A0A6H1U5X6_9CYAN|nr:adenylate/guanylate cyclase domain-containing protein [Oxynema aestuarii]QIZ73433.1 adenylate/guanylate cyclase domain-containing protein [Oxynema aestuarii AP17]